MDKKIYIKSLETIFSETSLASLAKNRSKWLSENESKIEEIKKWNTKQNENDTEILTTVLSFYEIKNKELNYKNEKTNSNTVNSFLSYCYENNYKNLSFTILKYNFNSVISKDQLNLAIASNHHKSVQLILKKSPKIIKQVNKVTSYDCNFTYLSQAISKEHVETLEVLLKNGANVNERNTNNGSPFLHLALVTTNNEKITELLLKNNADVNAPNEDGYSPLHFAALKAHVKNVKVLLKYGADVNASSNKRENPLHLATQNADTKGEETVKVLLENDADVNACNIEGNSPLHFAAQNANAKIVQLLLVKSNDKVNGKNKKDGNTPLHLAALQGSVETVKVLLKYGADVNLCNINGDSPLFLAATITNNKEMTELLLEKGADVNACNEKQTSPLHLAALQGHVETVKVLLEKGANVNAGNEKQTSPLHLAALQGHVETVKVLLEKGADVNLCDINGDSPLHVAAQTTNNEKMTELLLENHADVNAHNIDGNTPLHFAGLQGHVETVKVLLEKGANVNAPNKDGNTPLHLAALQGYVETVKVLLENGCNVNLCNINGESPLHVAAQNPDTKGEETVEILLKNKADVNASSKEGYSPLYLAAQNSNTKIVTLLLEKGANVNAPNKDGNTPLHVAAQNSNTKGEETVEILLKNKADVNASSKEGYSPLHVASLISNNEKMTELLLENHADVNAHNIDGNTPLHFAALQGHVETVKVLLKYGADVNASNKDGNTPWQLAPTTLQNKSLKIIKPKKNKEATDAGNTRINEPVFRLPEHFKVVNSNNNNSSPTKRKSNKRKSNQPKENNIRSKQGQKLGESKQQTKFANEEKPITLTKKPARLTPHSWQPNVDKIEGSKEEIMNQQKEALKAQEKRRLEVEEKRRLEVEEKRKLQQLKIIPKQENKQTTSNLEISERLNLEIAQNKENAEKLQLYISEYCYILKRSDKLDHKDGRPMVLIDKNHAIPGSTKYKDYYDMNTTVYILLPGETEKTYFDVSKMVKISEEENLGINEKWKLTKEIIKQIATKIVFSSSAKVINEVLEPSTSTDLEAGKRQSFINTISQADLQAASSSNSRTSQSHTSNKQHDDEEKINLTAKAEYARKIKQQELNPWATANPATSKTDYPPFTKWECQEVQNSQQEKFNLNPSAEKPQQQQNYNEESMKNKGKGYHC